MSEDQVKTCRLSGAAAEALVGKSRKRRSSTRKASQCGGDNSGALMQVAAQRTPTDGAGAGQALLGQIQQALGKVGPNAIQMGGDNSGALMQIATNPNLGAAPKDMPQQIQQAALQALQHFGPDKAQQFGGRKSKQLGGDVTAGTIQLQSSEAPTLPGNVVHPVISGVNPSQPAPVGGARLVLAPPKRKTRIALKAKKMHGGQSCGVEKALTGGTRKARKIHLRVKGVTARLAKAKKARKEAMHAPIHTVKTRLESAGVIKKGSKAPESMLRNMYADLLITKKGL